RRIKQNYELEAMAHFTCVAATTAQLRDTLDQMVAVGIDNVLALRGDPPAGEQEWTKTEGGLEYSRELVELIRRDYPFAIGAACDPQRPAPRPVLGPAGSALGLDVQRVSDLRRAVGRVVADVDRVVLPVGADAPRPEEPAAFGDHVLAQLAFEDQRAALHPV